MPHDHTGSIEARLSTYVELVERRRREPDPFHILNITRTEAPYTHFLGWVLDPTAAHPWNAEFLIGLLQEFKQPLPPSSAPITFFVETFGYKKAPDDDVGFTHPDIAAFSPDEKAPVWCLVIENKFDSKEGRASTSATQCAKYEERTRKQCGEIQYAFLFTTRTGDRPLGETCFAPVSYEAIVRVFHKVRHELQAAGKWHADGITASDGYAYFLLDAFLRHLEFIMPEEDVRNAFRSLSRKERPAGISTEWVKKNASVVERASELSDVIETWDRDSMKEEMVTDGATSAELEAFDRIYEWGHAHGRCEFGKPKRPSVTIKIPTSGQEVQILCIQVRRLKFYWVHFIGSKESGNVAGPHTGSKFAKAYDLVEWFCQRLNQEFNWDLSVASEKGGFLEPSCPLADIAEPKRLEAFLAILTQVADNALLTHLPLPSMPGTGGSTPTALK